MCNQYYGFFFFGRNRSKVVIYNTIYWQFYGEK